MAANVILVIVVLAFAWNLGVHYTGAVMGMPHAAGAVAIAPALILIAIAALLGATFASGGVQETVGLHIIDASQVSKVDAIAIVAAAGGLTLFYNYAKVPTSTIQILVFCVVGVGLAADVHIEWRTIGELAIVWVLAPAAAVVLGFVFTRALDRVIPPAAARVQIRDEARGRTLDDDAPHSRAGHRRWAAWFPAVAAPLPQNAADAARSSSHSAGEATLFLLRWLPAMLLTVGIAASFVMGANDVSNATGALIMTDLYSLRVAGLIGGVAIAVGAVTWGRRILRTVAFDVVHMDLTMASAAQGVQALVVLIAVTQGYFTSMNQALIGAMAGTGLARGTETVQRRQFVGILRGWALGPVSGLAIAFLLDHILVAITGR